MINLTSTDPQSYINSLTKEEIKSFIDDHNVKNYDVKYYGLKPTMLIIMEDLHKDHTMYIDSLVENSTNTSINWSILD